jgi:hypothetical protein
VIEGGFMKKAIVILIILFSILLLADVRELRKETDKMEGVIYYYSKNTPKHMFNLLRNNDLFYLYIIAYDNRKPKIYLCAHIEIPKWINLDEVIVMADEERYIFRFDPKERHRIKHSETRRTEYFKVSVAPEWIPALKAISKATQVKLRYNGNDGYKNKIKLKKKHLDAIIQIIDAYEELGGSMEHLASYGARYIQYAYLETIARTPSIAENKTFPEMNRFDDENISIVWAPQSEELSFKIKNNSQSTLSIIWDESTFVD